MRGKLLLALICTSLAALLTSTTARADDDEGGGFVIKIFPERQKERRSSRWTLAEWMRTKKIFSDQDSWLAAHTNKFPGDFTYGFDLDSWRMGHEMDFYVYWFGIHLRYEQTGEWFQKATYFDILNRSGQFALQVRPFGGNPQNTNLILRVIYNYDHIINPPTVAGPYGGLGAGAELQIYFAHWLGVRGDWQYRFDANRIKDGRYALGGASWFVAPFIEVGAGRLEVGYRSRDWNFKDKVAGGLAPESQPLSGLFGRLRIFL